MDPNHLFLQTAVSQLGVKEIEGEQHNQTIINYAKESGFDWVNDDETPWCGIFLSWCATKASLEGAKSARARAWLEVGEETKDPTPGDVVVYWRGSIESSNGHSAIFMGFNADHTKIFTLGGNQGNRVSMAAYDASQVLGFRKLTKSGILELPPAPLQAGSRGSDVKKLQAVLNAKGFNCGTPDGIWGGNTTKALSKLQESNPNLQVTGTYNENTRNVLTALLGQ